VRPVDYSLDVRRTERIAATLHPAILSPRRGWVGTGIILGIFVLGAALGLYYAGLHHGTAPTAVSFEVSVTDAGMTPSTLKVRDGDQVVLSISTDRSRTIVLRGYDQTFQLTPGIPVSATFVASKPGTFEFVDQSSGKKIGQLVVNA
jgi:hypothetical protein